MVANSTSGALPAVVTIQDLPAGTTLTGTELLEAVQTSGGVANSVQITVAQIMTTALGGLPVGGGTGQVLNKSSGANYSTQWSSISSLVTASSGITVAGSTTLQVSLSTVAGLSVLGVAGTTGGVPGAIPGTADQVLVVNHAGTAVLFGPVNLVATAAVTGVLPIANMTAINLASSGGGGVQGVLPVPSGGTNTTTLTAFGALYANSTSSIGATAAGTTAWALVGNGTAVAPSFAVLTVPGGGHGTSTLTLNGVIYGNGTSTVGITAAGTTLWPLLANGTSVAPSFQQLNLTASVTGVLAIANGGTNNTGTLATGGVIFSDGTRLTQNSGQFVWDGTNNRLGIGTSAPNFSFVVLGISQFGPTSSSAGCRVQTQGTAIFQWLGINHDNNAFNQIDFLACSTAQISVFPSGDMSLGLPSLAATAVAGFPFISACAGTATGTPTSRAGRVPMVYDTTNNKLWIFNGSWKSATFV